MAPTWPKASAPSNASTLPTTHTTSATPRSPPDCRSTDPGTVKIPEPIVVPTTMRTRSRSVRTRARSRAPALKGAPPPPPLPRASPPCHRRRGSAHPPRASRSPPARGGAPRRERAPARASARRRARPPRGWRSPCPHPAAPRGAPGEVLPFRVLAGDHAVDTPAAATQGGEVGIEQRYGTKVDVEIEAETESQQDVPCVLVARYPRVADRAQQDGVRVVAQAVERPVWERFLGFEVVVGTVRQTLELEGDAALRGGPLDRAEGRVDDVGPDSIPRDHCDS